MDILEIHTWNSVADDVERPDRIVIDLDPGPRVGWKAVVSGARRVRAVLQAIGLVPFVKTTGGNGLHVVVPLRPVHDWTTCLAFARAVAEVLVRDDPATFTTSLPKANRTDKILLDYLRNNRTNTSVAAFSTRASGRGPLSVPISWEELQTIGSSHRYDVRNLRGRLLRLKRDPWRDYATSARKIPAGALDALRRTL
jgi:bifunctional non-homologous end joining protein LigD